MTRLMLVGLLFAACGDGSDGGDASGGGVDGGGGIDGTPSESNPRVYVGTYGAQIYAFELSLDTLVLTPAGQFDSGNGPSFLAVDGGKRWLAAVDELEDQVETFAIEPSGALTPLGGQPAGGGGPAHITFDATGAWVLTANYGGGSASVFPIDAAGMIGPSSTTVSPGANAHQVVLDASNSTAYVPCLGADLVGVYDFGAASGTLTPRTPATAPAGSGPRHLAIAPDGDFAWLMDERSSTVTTYAVETDGSLTEGATVSSLPSDFTGTNTGAEIAVHPSGRWLYASNRGLDSIAVFAIGGGGSLTLLDNTPTGGDHPRHFALTPDAGAILVANTFSDTIHGLRVDSATGLLTDAGELAGVPTPTFIGFVQLP